MSEPAILVPSGLSRVHPQLETSIKSIAASVRSLQKAARSGSTAGGAAFGARLAALEQRLAALQERVEAIGAPAGFRAGQALPAYCAVCETLPGVAGIADNAEVATAGAVVGITTAVAAPGAVVELARNGDTLSNPAWAWTTGPVFLGVAGSLTQVAPTAGLRVALGWAIAPTAFLVLASPPEDSASDVLGMPRNLLVGPPWAGAVNGIGAINETAAENVIDRRVVPAGEIGPNYVLSYSVSAFIQGGGGGKFLRLCIAGDAAHSLLAAFDAGVEGMVRFEFVVPARSGPAQVALSRVDLNNNAGWLVDRQDAVNADFAEDAAWEARAWVADAGDSITVDMSDLRVERTRR